MTTASILANVLSGGPVALLAKVTVVLVAAICLAFALRNASAAMRHLIWLTALASSLAIVVASPIAPTIKLRLREHAPVRPIVFVPRAAALGPSTRMARPVTFQMPIRSARVVTASSYAARSWPSVDAGGVVMAIWLAGCLFVLGRLALGHIVLARLVRRAYPLTSPAWLSAIDEASYITGVSRRVSLLVSDDIGAPVTSGVFRPVILVPLESSNWSDERRHVVLVHELAHVARLDYLAQLVATVVCALLWFHPLVWLAASRLRLEAEHSADDRVLAAGTPSVSYAAHLLELARVESSLHHTATVAVGMVKPSRLEGRFRAMLDTSRSRADVSARTRTLATSCALAAMMPFAGLRAVVTTPVTTLVSAKAIAIMPLQTVSDTTIELNIDATSAERVMLELKTGGKVTLRGWDNPGVRVRAHLAGPDWRATNVALKRSGNVVQLLSTMNESMERSMTDHSFELWVPKRIDVQLSSSGGSVTINDVAGEFRGHTGGGAIVIEGASGVARLTTGGGDVRVVNSTLDGSVSTGGGEVIIANVAGGLRGSSGSGPVVTVPGIVSVNTAEAAVASTSVNGFVTSTAGTMSINGVASGRDVATTISVGPGAVGIGRGVGTGVGNGVATTNITSNGQTTTIMTPGAAVAIGGSFGFTLSKPGGEISIEEAPNGARLTTGGGPIYVGSSSGSLSVSTGGGDIDLPRVGGSVSASTGAGDVTITVINGDGTRHSVDVFTGKGRVELELPSSLDARFELETAYTEGQSRTTIDSDFALDRTETSNWDDSMGTPRKFVRARGTVGNGSALIRIRAVNGDIIIRRGR